MSDATETPDDSTRRTVVFGFFLLAVFVPMGLTLEALHALKVPAYFGSSMRREMWTLAHAHGGILGVLCLVYGSVAGRWLSAPSRESIARWVRWGAVLMPLGSCSAGSGTTRETRCSESCWSRSAVWRCSSRSCAPDSTAGERNRRLAPCGG